MSAPMATGGDPDSVRRPVLERLERLAGQWEAFADDPEARVLCWKFAGDELAMLDAFLEAEGDERSGQQPDLFVSLDVPFERHETHGAALRDALVELYGAVQDELQQQGVPGAWRPTPLHADTGDLARLAAAGQSFIEQHELPRHLVLVLRPATIADEAAYLRWLHAWAATAPRRLRSIRVHGPDGFAGEVAPVQPTSVRVTYKAAELGMPEALLEVSAAAGHADTPGGRFRSAFVELGIALRSGPSEAALAQADATLAIARSAGWASLETAVQLTVGAVLASARRGDEARARYEAAEAVASAAAAGDDADARSEAERLRLQARLGHGSTLIDDERWEAGAAHWQATAELASANGERVSAIDAYRLAAYCHEERGAAAIAYATAALALPIAAELDDATLQGSNFAYLADMLIRLAADHGDAAQLERDVVARFGRRDWRPQPPAGTGTAS